MLREKEYVRQIKGEPRRRWFYDDFFDLIVWYGTDDSIIGFQLTASVIRANLTFTFSHMRWPWPWPLRYPVISRR